jgi:zinc finger protein
MNLPLFLTNYDTQYIEPAISGPAQPVRYILNIEGEADLVTKIIKSKCACVEIPELDIRILPGSNSQDLICDVFGLISRIEEAIKIIQNVEKTENVDLLNSIAQIKGGKKKATLIIVDPSGLSLIMGKASKEILNT